MQITKSLLLLSLLSLFMACSEGEEPAVGDTQFVITNKMDKFSYALGVSMASQMGHLESVGLDSLNVEIYLQAVRQTIMKQELQMSIDESNEYVQTHIVKMRSKWMEDNKDRISKQSTTATGPVF